MNNETDALNLLKQGQDHLRKANPTKSLIFDDYTVSRRANGTVLRLQYHEYLEKARKTRELTFLSDKIVDDVPVRKSRKG